ncbi:hypothetical protein ACFX13_016736 [Malus domestica]
MANDPRFKNTVFATSGKIPIPMSATTVTHIQNVYGGTLMQGARQVVVRVLKHLHNQNLQHVNVTPISVFVVDGIGCLGRPCDSKNPSRPDIDD